DDGGWTNSIAGTVAHEAAHNYGLSHQDGEDDANDNPDLINQFLMRRGNGYSPEDRSKPRYFSNFETSTLARIVGLSIDTMWTWQVTNRNTPSVSKVRIELVSPEPQLILSWPFSGDTSPWINPVLTVTGTTTIGHKQFTLYAIEWSTPNDHWRDGPPGQ